ncbi:MAG: dephospho-CoA kinase [Treponema sp.]|nr:dephospho-CoA kinase [Treponema sp.]
MIIGLTGKYCAGKNYVASLLEKKGLPVLDVDKLGYPVLESEKEAIFSMFGDDLKRADGSLDRRLLGQRVFGKPEELKALETIIHPPVNKMTNEWIDSRKGSCVINAALLHRSSAFNKLEKIIIVTAPFLTRFLRARKRDKLTYKEIIERFKRQKDFNAQYLTLNAEIYRIENSGFFGSGRLSRSIDKLIKGIN